MFSESGRQPLVTLGPRSYRWIRRLMVVTSVLCLGTAAFAFSATSLPEPQVRAAFGLWFLLLGSATGLWAWRGRWRPTETDAERSLDAWLSRRLAEVLTGAELLFLSLALLGVLLPETFGAYWLEHRSSVAMFAVLAVLDLVVRAARRRRPRKAGASE
ncbi:MAG: hypothetical protein HYV19_06655 [Gemmatimonadetes bacterium]|nr:hypothetical protein [Gemmatimonadota bacterium]